MFTNIYHIVKMSRYKILRIKEVKPQRIVDFLNFIIDTRLALPYIYLTNEDNKTKNGIYIKKKAHALT